MIGKFKYTGSISKTYYVRYYDDDLSAYQLSSINYSKDLLTCNVDAYACSNVDTFGAQMLCWRSANASLSTDITSTIKTKAEAIKPTECWSQISTDVNRDANEVAAAGWMSVNSRTLTPNS